MDTRTFELTRPILNSNVRLTITPTRVTLKIPPTFTNLEVLQFSRFSMLIAKDLSKINTSHRGVFKAKHRYRRIDMHTGKYPVVGNRLKYTLNNDNSLSVIHD